MLDLRGLADPDLTIIDKSTREWPIAGDFPLRAVLPLLQHAAAWQAGTLNAEAFDATVEALAVIFRRRTPAVTRDDVLDAFDLEDIPEVINFLALRKQAQRKRRNGSGQPAPSQTTAVAVTPRPTRSPRKSSVES